MQESASLPGEWGCLGNWAEKVSYPGTWQPGQLHLHTSLLSLAVVVPLKNEMKETDGFASLVG